MINNYYNNKLNKDVKKTLKNITIISLWLLSVLSLSGCNKVEAVQQSTNMNNIKREIINQVSNNLEDQDNILRQYNWNYKWNTVISKFTKAKRILYKIYNKNLWQDFRKTIYCWCDFHWKIVNKKSCWLTTKWYKKRSKRIEREHVVPAENFWRSFEERRNPRKFNKCKLKSGKYKSGRKCAETNSLFNLMEADLYNLFPSDWALNAYRSNYNIAEIPWKERRFWACDFKIKNKKMEPPQDEKGDIARVYMYMQLVYGRKRGLKIISNKNEKLIKAWNKMDPISKKECQVYFAKKKYQKNINPILENPCERIMK